MVVHWCTTTTAHLFAAASVKTSVRNIHGCPRARGGPHRPPVVRSYLGYYTRSHQNSAVKRLWAGIVLGWVTSREVPVLHPPFCFLLSAADTFSAFFWACGVPCDCLCVSLLACVAMPTLVPLFVSTLIMMYARVPPQKMF